MTIPQISQWLKRSFATVYKHLKQVAGDKRNINQIRLRDLDFEEACLRSPFADKLRKIQEARDIIQEEARFVDIVDLYMSNIDGCVEGLIAQSQKREGEWGTHVHCSLLSGTLTRIVYSDSTSLISRIDTSINIS